MSSGYLLLGGLTLILAILAPILKRKLWLSEPLLTMLVGIAVGPAALDWFDLQSLMNQEVLIEQVARITLGISLIGIALRLPDRFVWTHRRSLAVMLLVAMPAMWVVSGILANVVLGLGWWSALLLGAVVTPTDPVVASSIVTGELAEKNVRADLRHLLSAESGANDGLAFLLVMLPYQVLNHAPGEALERFLLDNLLREVIGGLLLGTATGWLLGEILVRVGKWETHEGAGQTPLLAVMVATAVALLGGATLLHTDGILAVFAAGLVFNHFVRDQHEARHQRVNEVMKRFFDVPVFVLFGMVIPWQQIAGLGAAGIVFAILVLALRRLPVLFALRRFVPPLRTNREALFAGWFGPIAVAAMVYAAWADLHGADTELWPAASLVIFLSILLHGISATPITQWLPQHETRTFEDPSSKEKRCGTVGSSARAEA